MTKETIIAQLEALLQNEDFKETQAGVSSIRASYNEIVNEANKDEHDTAIEALFNSFNEKEAAYNAASDCLLYTSWLNTPSILFFILLRR